MARTNVKLARAPREDKMILRRTLIVVHDWASRNTLICCTTTVECGIKSRENTRDNWPIACRAGRTGRWQSPVRGRQEKRGRWQSQRHSIRCGRNPCPRLPFSGHTRSWRRKWKPDKQCGRQQRWWEALQWATYGGVPTYLPPFHALSLTRRLCVPPTLLFRPVPLRSDVVDNQQKHIRPRSQYVAVFPFFLIFHHPQRHTNNKSGKGAANMSAQTQKEKEGRKQQRVLLQVEVKKLTEKQPRRWCTVTLVFTVKWLQRHERSN